MQSVDRYSVLYTDAYGLQHNINLRANKGYSLLQVVQIKTDWFAVIMENPTKDVSLHAD